MNSSAYLRDFNVRSPRTTDPKNFASFVDLSDEVAGDEGDMARFPPVRYDATTSKGRYRR